MATGYSPLMLDVAWLELLRGAFAPRRRWPPLSQPTDFVTLSVRSALDLLLRAKAYPRGSVALVSALTIPDIERVLQHHGLVVKAVDVVPSTMGVSEEELSDMLAAERPVCCIVAHVWGRINSLDTVARECAAHGCMLIEDLAESFCPHYDGHPDADVVCWSHGTIKTATAFGGGVVRVRDDALRTAMLALLARDPVQPTLPYVSKFLKYMVLWVVLNTRLNAAARSVLTWLQVDFQTPVVAQLRGFAGKQLITALRHRPCGALEGAVRRRRTTGVGHESLQRVATFRFASVRGVVVPGLECASSRFWLYPILVDPARRDKVVATLNAEGIHAASDSTQLCSLGGPKAVATMVAASVVYLPIHRLCSLNDIARVAAVLKRSAAQPIE